MEILYFNILNSTQKYLIEQIRAKSLKPPIAVVAKNQTNGVGSRDNSWVGGEGNLFFSFAIDINALPLDLPLESASIYFSFIMREILGKLVDELWLKWPNDLYYKNAKVGGTITKVIDNIMICGMGINLKENFNGYSSLNLNIEIDFLLKEYFARLNRTPSWKQVFSKYAIEFDKNRKVSAHIHGEYKSLENAILAEDGSLIIDNKRVYSLR